MDYDSEWRIEQLGEILFPLKEFAELQEITFMRVKGGGVYLLGGGVKL